MEVIDVGELVLEFYVLMKLMLKCLKSEMRLMKLGKMVVFVM